MAEYICPIIGDLCLRPGVVVPGAKAISNTGYCGGEELKDGICPNIFLYVKNEDSITGPNIKNLTVERKDSATIHINEIYNKGTKVLTVIESGRVQR